MSQSLIMRTVAVVSAVFGLALLFAPNGLMALYKAPTLNAPGVYNTMLYGGCLIALGAMNWSASKSTVMEARHVILGTFVANSIGFVVALVRQVTDSTQGFSLVLAGLKAFLEHNIRLNLIGDRYPKGIEHP
jgi:hypothetical protein